MLSLRCPCILHTAPQVISSGTCQFGIVYPQAVEVFFRHLFDIKKSSYPTTVEVSVVPWQGRGRRGEVGWALAVALVISLMRFFERIPPSIPPIENML